MSQVTVVLPDSVSEAEAKLQLAVRLFQVGSLSCGQAAELAGYSKRTFTKVSSQQSVSNTDLQTAKLHDRVCAKLRAREWSSQQLADCRHHGDLFKAFSWGCSGRDKRGSIEPVLSLNTDPSRGTLEWL